MKRFQTTAEANRLLLEGQIAMSKVEANGVCVDVDYLNGAGKDIDKKIARLTRSMEADKDIYREWKKHAGINFKMGSREQLSEVLFERMGYKSAGRTATMRHRTDKVALETIHHPFVQDFLKIEELKKAKSTYLNGVKRELVKSGGRWYVHPSFNLHIPVTFRSSSDKPNFQNIPKRNPELSAVIRRMYVPRGERRHFVELDFGQLEVRIAACYNKDPQLIQYLEDDDSDMHRDAACDIFKLRPEAVTSEARHAAKNQFVFPQFYGSVYFQCAPPLWDAMERRKLIVGTTGLPLRKYLKQHGITELGSCNPQDNPGNNTFVGHLKSVEQSLWNRLNVYSGWKKRWYASYQRDGGFMSLMGFGWHGFFKRNDVINYPVQCDAFQLNLWSVVTLQKWIDKYNLKTRIVGQVHDSIELDVPESELQDVLHYAHKVMTEKSRERFPWINVRLETDAAVAPAGESWNRVKKWHERNGTWKLKA